MVTGSTEPPVRVVAVRLSSGCSEPMAAPMVTLPAEPAVSVRLSMLVVCSSKGALMLMLPAVLPVPAVRVRFGSAVVAMVTAPPLYVWLP